MVSSFIKAMLVAMVLWGQFIWFGYTISNEILDVGVLGLACNIIGLLIAFYLAFVKQGDSNSK